MSKRNAPRQQLVHPVDRVVSDAFEYIAQVRLRVHPVELGGTDQAVNRSTPFTALIGADGQIVLAPQGNGPQGSLGGIVIDFDPPVIAVARQRRPPVKGITNRAVQCRFFRQLHQCMAEPGVQFRQQWAGPALTNSSSLIRRLSANVAFDGVQRRDSMQRFSGNLRDIGLFVQVEELTPSMGSTRRLLNRYCGIQLSKTGIGVRLQYAAEALEVSARTLALAIR